MLSAAVVIGALSVKALKKKQTTKFLCHKVLVWYMYIMHLYCLVGQVNFYSYVVVSSYNLGDPELNTGWEHIRLWEDFYS